MSGSFGTRLKEALEAAGKSRAELARVLRSPASGRLGVSVSAIGQVINGETSALSAENAVRAAKFLGVSSYWLAANEGPMHERSELTARAPPPPGYFSDEAALSRFGLLLAAVPLEMRATVATLLRDWALNGGDDDRRLGIQALLTWPSKQTGRPTKTTE